MTIVLQRLSKRFGDLSVVDRLSLEVADGEFFVLLGASGSGKSTVLRLVSGLIPPDEGAVFLHGREVTHLPPQAREVGFVFQNYSIFRHMSVAENVEFGLRIRGVGAAERARRRNELLDLVGLGGLGRRFAHQLSGGQQQRVALARALAYNPTVLLLDEPFSALDVKIRTQLRRVVRQIQQQLGLATILVTHDQEEAFELADRIGVMDRGQLLEIGTPEQIYHRPQHSFTATFVGAGSLLVGRVRDDGAHFGPWRLPIPPELPHEEGRAVQVLIRPEQVRLSAELPPDPGPFCVQGEVLEQTFTGPLRRVRLRFPHLPQTRQLAPPVPFGEDRMLLDAILPATAPLDTPTPWIQFAGWHILEQPRFHVLLLDTDAPGESHWDLARQIQDAFVGEVTVLAVAPDAPTAASRRPALAARCRQAGLRQADVRVRVGALVEQVTRELDATWHDLVIVRGRAVPGRPDPVLLDLLPHLECPLLVARGDRVQVRSLLVCTAGGEHGKTDIGVAGRLARRLRAPVRLLHVLTPDSPAGFEAIAREHLARGVTTLQMLDVAAVSSQVADASPTAAALRAAASNDLDLIVIGRHEPAAAPRLDAPDIMLDILSGADRPVLIVPA